MAEQEQSGAKIITDLGKILGAMMGLCIAIWFFGEPFLEKYVEGHIEIYEARHKEELSGKTKLRTLLADKMKVDSDEVHIELGRLYQSEYSTREDIYKRLKLIDSEWSLLREDVEYKGESLDELKGRVTSLKNSVTKIQIEIKAMQDRRR